MADDADIEEQVRRELTHMTIGEAEAWRQGYAAAKEQAVTLAQFIRPEEQIPISVDYCRGRFHAALRIRAMEPGE